MALFAREKYNLKYKVISFMADPITGHNMWVNPDADVIVTATEEAKQYLVSQGQPRYRIRVMSFPLNPKFFTRVEKTREEILKELGLDPSRMTVLVSAGGQGIGETGKCVRFISEKGYPLNIIAVCAKNESLYRELKEMVKKNSLSNIAVLGFVDNMHELLEASDFAITKPGPSTVFEHLVKNVPPILTHMAGLQEKGNVDFCLKYRVGWYVTGEKEMQVILEKILNTDILDEYRANIARNEFIRSLPNAPYDVARFVVEELSTKRKVRRHRRNAELRRLILGTRIGIRRVMLRNRKTQYRLRNEI